MILFSGNIYQYDPIRVTKYLLVNSTLAFTEQFFGAKFHGWQSANTHTYVSGITFLGF